MASEKIAAMIEEIKALSVLELSELVHAVEEEFGVSAAAAVAVAGPVAGPAAAEEEKTEFDVILAEVGADKIKVIKAVREITPVCVPGDGAPAPAPPSDSSVACCRFFSLAARARARPSDVYSPPAGGSCPRPGRAPCGRPPAWLHHA